MGNIKDDAAESAVRGFMPNLFLTQTETAKLLHVSERTLERWRLTGATGLPFIRAGRRVLYSAAAIAAFTAANTFRSTSETSVAA